jgi:hypothetical protein
MKIKIRKLQTKEPCNEEYFKDLCVICPGYLQDQPGQKPYLAPLDIESISYSDDNDFDSQSLKSSFTGVGYSNDGTPTD